MLTVKTLYETDFNLWLEQTAIFLKEGKLEQLDIENLIEEIEGMSRKEKDALESNLIRILQHLLKWKYQPEKRSPSWSYTIIEHSRRLNKAFKNSLVSNVTLMLYLMNVTKKLVKLLLWKLNYL